MINPSSFLFESLTLQIKNYVFFPNKMADYIVRHARLNAKKHKEEKIFLFLELGIGFKFH